MELTEEVVGRIQADRHRCWLALLDHAGDTTFDDLARAAGIEPLEKRWHEIDGARAEAFITALFHRSLAYGIEMMPATTAAWLASQFIDAAREYGSRFATNSGDLPGDNPFVSTPATSYPFDTGVAVIGTNGGGLIWFADET